MHEFSAGGRPDGHRQPQEEHRERIKLVLRQRQPASRQLVLHNGSQFSSQLQRFFAAVVQADHRLLGWGQALGCRLQVVDCTAGQHVRLDRVANTVYAELAAVLSYKDRWETRLTDLEKIAATWGRLSTESFKCREERSLSVWLTKQGVRFRANLMLPRRLHRLLNTSSPLLRERLQGWLMPRHGFKLKCQELREHIQATGSLPSFSHKPGTGRKLASWLRSQAQKGTLTNEQQKMLEDSHFLVKAKLREYTKQPLRVHIRGWQRRMREVLEFVAREGRLPRGRQERGMYQWLALQRRHFGRGLLLPELEMELQRSHPILADCFQKLPGSTG